MRQKLLLTKADLLKLHYLEHMRDGSRDGAEMW